MLNFFYLVIKLSWHGFRIWWVNPTNSRLTYKFFFSIQLSNFHDTNLRFDELTLFEGLTQLIQIFFLHYFFFHVGFYFFVFKKIIFC